VPPTPDDSFTLSDGTGPLHAETVGHGTRPVPAIIAARPGGRSIMGGMPRSQLSGQQLRGALVGRVSATGAYLERHRAAGRGAWAARRGAQVDPGREHLSGVAVPKAPVRTVPPAAARTLRNQWVTVPAATAATEPIAGEDTAVGRAGRARRSECRFTRVAHSSPRRRVPVTVGSQSDSAGRGGTPRRFPAAGPRPWALAGPSQERI
jgi:hypothetical protein